MSFFKRLFGKSDSRNPKPESGNDHQGTIDVRDLILKIEKGFNLSEIKVLCFDLQIDYENLAGETKKAKVLSLVQYCQKQKRLDLLVAFCEQQRPHFFKDDLTEQDFSTKSEQRAHSARSPESRIVASEVKYDGAQTELEMDFDQYRSFVRERFTLDEFLDFLLTDDYFQQFAFNVPANVTHNYATREVWHYARRRRATSYLLEKLKEVDPELFEKFANAKED